MNFYGEIRSGVLSIPSRKRVLSDLKGLKDGWYEIILKRRNRRSLPQNSYYWGVVVWEIRERLKELGNAFDSETVHAWLKEKFNPVQIAGTDGEVIGEVGETTTEMNKEEFGIYLDKIILWAAEFLGITIPLPGTQQEFEF